MLFKNTLRLCANNCTVLCYCKLEFWRLRIFILIKDPEIRMITFKTITTLWSSWGSLGLFVLAEHLTEEQLAGKAKKWWFSPPNLSLFNWHHMHFKGISSCMTFFCKTTVSLSLPGILTYSPLPSRNTREMGVFKSLTSFQRFFYIEDRRLLCLLQPEQRLIHLFYVLVFLVNSQ